MAVRRSPHRRAKLREQAAVQASAEPDHLQNMLQDLKLLDIKRRVIALHRKRMPFLIAGLLPVGLIVLSFVLQGSILFIWLGLAIAGGYASQFYGPLGSLTRIKQAGVDAELQIMKITERLPEMGQGEKLALFGVMKASSAGLVTSELMIWLDRNAFDKMDEKTAFSPLGKYIHLGVAHFANDGSLNDDLMLYKDQYWLGYARLKKCSDKQISKALRQLSFNSAANT